MKQARLLLMDQIRLLTARRAYEFRPDDLRLSVLSTPDAQQQIRQLFEFQIVQIGPPLQTFGPIPATIPPGVIFDYGVASNTETDVPVRFLHFEPFRIVVDVAGPTATIDWMYEQLNQLLRDIRDIDGSPAVGEPIRTVDYSEISAQLSFGLGDLLKQPVGRLAQDTFGEYEGNSIVFPANINFLSVDPSQEIGSQTLSGPSLQVRAGTKPEDRIFFSTAYLPTDPHLAWLSGLDTELG